MFTGTVAKMLAIALVVMVGILTWTSNAEAHRTKSGHGRKAHVVKVWKAKEGKRTYRCQRFSKSSHRKTRCTLVHRKHRRPSSSSYAKRMRVIAFARRQIGKPYIWGATGPRGYDCSGLIWKAYRLQGVSIPRVTYGQLSGMRRPRGRRAGDLVFANPGHVALYIGRGKVIVARRAGTTLTIQSAARFTYATRRAI